MDEVFLIINYALERVFGDLFIPLDNHFTFLNSALIVFIAFSVYRFLLRPIFGGSVGSSDKARKVSKEKNSDSTEVSIIG